MTRTLAASNCEEASAVEFRYSINADANLPVTQSAQSATGVTMSEPASQFPAPDRLPDGAQLAPGEHPLLAGSFMVSMLAFYLHTRIAVTDRRLYAVRPNTFFGLIPVGATRSNYPIDNIAGVNAASRFSVSGALVRIVIFFIGITLLGEPRASGGGVLLIVGVLILINTPRQAIQVTNSGGGVIQFSVSVLERSRTVAFANAVSEVLARRQAPMTSSAPIPSAEPQCLCGDGATQRASQPGLDHRRGVRGKANSDPRATVMLRRSRASTG